MGLCLVYPNCTDTSLKMPIPIVKLARFSTKYIWWNVYPAGTMKYRDRGLGRDRCWGSIVRAKEARMVICNA